MTVSSNDAALRDPPTGVPSGLIAVVDDNPAESHWMLAALRPLREWQVVRYADSRKFLGAVRAGLSPELTLVDYRMPVVDGMQIGAALSSSAAPGRGTWVLLTGLLDEEIEQTARGLGAADVLVKPLRADTLRAKVRRLLRENTSDEARDADATLFEVLARLARLRDDTTGSHVQRMALYSVEIARTLGLPEEMLRDLLQAAPLHDIGKIGVPDRILNKRGRLDDDEMAVMRRHAAYGAAVLRGHGSRALDMARNIAMSHHERWDGQGYPQGLAGDAIPLEARIVAVADVFDALTTRRPYKEAWPNEQAIAHIRAASGGHFDPAVVSAFDACLPELQAIQARLRDQEPTEPLGLADAPPEPPQPANATPPSA